MTEKERYYTYKGAAKRVGRSVHRIKQWRREGMETELDAEGRVIIAHSVLMAEFRARLERDPVQRIRVQRALESAEAEERARPRGVSATVVIHDEARRLDTGAPNPPNV